MPITDLGSYVTTGQEIESHWTDVNTNRAANSLTPLALTDGYAVGDLTVDISVVASANTDIEDLDNAFDIAAVARDSSKESLRDRMIEFRKAVAYRLPDSGYERALPKTFRPQGSEQKTLKALDDMASVWTRIDADTGSPNFTPPLLLRASYNVATFTADVATLRTNYKAVTDAENDLRIARRQRDVLLDPFRDRLVQYREAIRVEYGDEHPFFLSLPDVYPPSGGGGPTLTTFPFDWLQSEPGTVLIWFQMPAGLIDVLTLFAREGAEALSFQVDGVPPGQTVQATWTNVTIAGEVDEVKLRNSLGEDIAEGVRDTELPNPGP